MHDATTDANADADADADVNGWSNENAIPTTMAIRLISVEHRGRKRIMEHGQAVTKQPQKRENTTARWLAVLRASTFLPSE